MAEPQKDPWMPFRETDQQRSALQALYDGVANEGQQKVALQAIFELCGLDDLSYRPDSDRDTAFAEGKRFVGLQLYKIAHIKAKGD